MRKKFICFLLVLFTLALILVCIKKSKNDQVSSNENIGFPGGVLYDSDTHTEPYSEKIEVYEKQKEEESFETTEGEDVTFEQKVYDDNENIATMDDDKEKNIDKSVIKENTCMEDMVKPPSEGSDGVL